MSYLRGKNYFDEDGKQNYLVFLPIGRYFRLNDNTLYILLWKSKGLSTEIIDTINTKFSPSIDYVGNKIRVKLTGSCLKKSNSLLHVWKNSKYLYRL